MPSSRFLPPHFLAVVFLANALTLLRAAPTPLLFFDFNQVSDNSVAGKGALSLSATLQPSKTHPAALVSKDGEGLSGKPGDFALDLRAATGMGNKGEGGVAILKNPPLDSLKSFTLTGWFKCQAFAGDGARLFDYAGDKSGFIYCVSDGRWALQVNGKGWNTGTLPSPQMGSWVFFAVTYDSTKSADNVTFYEAEAGGDLNSESRSVANPEALRASTAGILALGNWPSGQRPLQGLLDNLAIYGSSSDGSGALSADDLKQIFTSAGATP